MDSSTGAVEDSTANHLPECPQLTEKPDWYCCEDCDPGVWDDCICDRLRACEQRAEAGAYNAGYVDGSKDAREGAFYEAREAVMALCQHPKSMPNGWLCSHALAASTIDALRDNND